MLNAIPRVVLAPLFLLWFGLGIWSKVALAVTLVFFVMFLPAFTRGVRDASQGMIDNVRMLGIAERQLVHTCGADRARPDPSEPADQPRFAMVGAVVGEYLGSTRGLGYVISEAEGMFDTTGRLRRHDDPRRRCRDRGPGVTRLERWLLR